MTSQQLDKLETKLNFVRLVASDLEAEYREVDGADRLMSIIETYESLLLRTKFNIATDLDDLNEMRDATIAAGNLIDDLVINEPELMHDWRHTEVPQNKAHAMASFMGRIMLELTGVIEQFETKYPALKSMMDADCRYRPTSDEKVLQCLRWSDEQGRDHE